MISLCSCSPSIRVSLEPRLRPVMLLALANHDVRSLMQIYANFHADRLHVSTLGDRVGLPADDIAVDGRADGREYCIVARLDY